MLASSLSLILLGLQGALATSHTVIVPPGQAVGECSPMPITTVSYTLSAPSPGLDGAYIIDQSYYTQLVAPVTSNSLGINTFFSYSIAYSCASPPSITTCSINQSSVKSRILTIPAVKCLVILPLNSTTTSMTVTYDIIWSDDSAISTTTTSSSKKGSGGIFGSGAGVAQVGAAPLIAASLATMALFY